ncbi:MAG TPA: GDSL-type esterase/lipase family protein, partial [Myxococcota bacterium]
VSADWVSLVGQALDVDVVNAGVNGDLAWNARLRLQEVLDTKPNDLVVLVGSNDVLAGLDEVRERRYMTSKNLPQRPTLAWYRDNLIAISERAKSASVPVLFASLPPLGEDLDSDVNKRVQSANEIIAMVAQETGARFVDVYAPLANVLRASGSKRAFTGTTGVMFGAIFRRYGLGWSFDRISAANGYRLLTDGIHANESAARIIADTIAAALSL